MSAAEVVGDSRPLSAAEAKDLFSDLTSAPALVLAVSGGPDSTALLFLAACTDSAPQYKSTDITGAEYGKSLELGPVGACEVGESGAKIVGLEKARFDLGERAGK